MGEKQDDESLKPLAEQAEIITDAWVRALSGMPPGPSQQCFKPQALWEYLHGSLPQEKALEVAAHLADCGTCRHLSARLRVLRDAEVGEGTGDLRTIREMVAIDPAISSSVLTRISRRISQLLVPDPPALGWPVHLSIKVVSAEEPATGEVVPATMDNVPRVDWRYRLRFDVSVPKTTCLGGRLHIMVRNHQGWITLGTVPVSRELAVVILDLSDLNLRPGFLPLEALRIVAELPKVEPAGETDLMKSLQELHQAKPASIDVADALFRLTGGDASMFLQALSSDRKTPISPKQQIGLLEWVSSGLREYLALWSGSNPGIPAPFEKSLLQAVDGLLEQISAATIELAPSEVTSTLTPSQIAAMKSRKKRLTRGVGSTAKKVTPADGSGPRADGAKKEG